LLIALFANFHGFPAAKNGQNFTSARKIPQVSFQISLKSKTVGAVAATAIGKIFAAESTLVVVTTGAALRVSGRREMHRRQRRGNLPPACHPGSDRMTTGAI
jgi:hypothetical protein